MNKDLGWALFLFGVIVGIYTGVIIYESSDVARIFRSMDLEPPQEMYEIEIDELMFHCLERPTVYFSRLHLGTCAESYGKNIVIKSFETYTVRIVNN